MEPNLEAIGLGQYAEALRGAGYDDWSVIASASSADFAEMTACVNMLPGHALKLRQRLTEKCKRTFDDIDTNNDGVIDRAEFTKSEAIHGDSLRTVVNHLPLQTRVAHGLKCWAYCSILLVIVALVLGIVCEVELKGEVAAPKGMKFFEYNISSIMYQELPPQYTPGLHKSYIASTMRHAAICIAMLVPLTVARIFSKDGQEVLSLIVWLWLGVSVAMTMHGWASSSQEAHDFIDMVRDVTDDNFNDFPVMHFADIGEAAHWYAWMKNVIGGALFAGQANLQPGAGAFLPGMTVVNARAPAEKGATVISPYGCYLKQFRVKTVPCPAEATRNCIPKFDSHTTMETKPRNVDERWYDPMYANLDGALVRPLDYVGGLSGIVYPGEGGLAPVVTKVSLGNDGHMIMGSITNVNGQSRSWGYRRRRFRARIDRPGFAAGFWPAYWTLCGEWANQSTLGATYDASNCIGDGRPINGWDYQLSTFQNDIDRLEQTRWIDSKTAMVHLTCQFINRNINMNATIRYVVEFTNAGLTRPYSPFIHATHKIETDNDDDPRRSFSLVLLFGMWSLMENILIESYDDNVLTGKGHGALREGWRWWLPTLPRAHPANIINVAIFAVSTVVQYYRLAAAWYRPTETYPMFSGYIYSKAVSVEENHFWFAILILLVCLEAVFMCDSIPYLNIIGRTLAASIGPIVMFTLVFGLIMYGFTVLFYIVYQSSIPTFSTMPQAFFALFRGMLGDVPLDDMLFAKPLLTPGLFMTFCFLTLFVVFTVLIAVISDAYQEVLEDKEGQKLDQDDEGGVAVILRFVLGLTGHYVPAEEGPPTGPGAVTSTSIGVASEFNNMSIETVGGPSTAASDPADDAIDGIELGNASIRGAE